MANNLPLAPFVKGKPSIDKGVPLAPWLQENKPSPANSGTKIARQKANVASGEEYGPGGMGNPSNVKKFESTGEPFTIFGVPIGDTRVQKTTNAEGEPRTKFVMKPMAGDNNPTGPAFMKNKPADMTSEDYMKKGIESGYVPPNSFESGLEMQRMAGGAALETIKSSVDLALWLAKGGGDPKINPIAKSIDELSKSFDENFPTMPAANQFEKSVQEIAPVIVGYITGGTELKAIKEAPELTPGVIKFLEDMWVTYKKTDPATAKKKIELIVKSVLKETKANVGTVAMTPEDIGSMSEDVLPDSGNAGTDRAVGLFVDNQAFSVGMAGIGKVFGLGGNFLKSIFKLDKRNNEHIAYSLLRTFDEGVTDATPPEELERRILIFNDLVNKNKDFDVAIAGAETTINLDATSAIVKSAREYMEKVHADEAMQFPQEVFDEMINKRAQTMVENIISVKQALKNNPVIATADSNVLNQASNTLEGASNAMAEGPLPSNRGELPDFGMTPKSTKEKVIGAASTSFGEPVANTLNTVAPDAIASNTAKLNLEEVRDKNTLVQMLTKAREEGKLGSTKVERDEITRLTENELINIYTADKNTIDTFFKNIPSKSVDSMELAQAIKDAGDMKGLLETLGLSPTEADLVQKVPNDFVDDKGVRHSPVADLAKQIENAGLNDLNTLITKVRPLLAQQKNIIWKSGRINKDTTPLASVIDFIESQANEGDDAFMIAMDNYKRFADKWLNTQPLSDVARSIDAIRPATTSGTDWKPVETFDQGRPTANKAAHEAFASAQNAFSDEEMQKFMAALRDPAGINEPALKQALLAQAVKQIISPNVDSTVLTAAMQPLIRDLEKMGDTKLVATVHDALDQLRLAESGFANAAEKDAIARSAYNTIMESARTNAAYEFVYKGANKARPVDPGSAQSSFDTIFESKTAPDKVIDLIDQAKAANNQMAVDGLKAAYGNWIKAKIFTKTPVGTKVTSEGAIAVRDLSSAKLKSILEDPGDLTIPTLEKVFKDDPKTGTAIVTLLQELHAIINNRATKVNPSGSNTVNDANLQRTVNLMITLTLGVLNPVATKARGMAGVLLQDNKAAHQAAIEAIMSRLVTDPQFLTTSMEALAKDRTGKTWIGSVFKAGALANKAMSKGVFTTVHPTVDEQTQDALPTK